MWAEHRRSGELHVRKPAHERLDDDLHRHPQQVDPETEVSAKAERKVRIRGPSDVELIGILIRGRITQPT